MRGYLQNALSRQIELQLLSLGFILLRQLTKR